jgi:hypothetical protein
VTRLDTFPNYFLVDFTQFYLTLIWHLVILAKCFGQSKELRDATRKKFLDCLQLTKPKTNYPTK